MNPTMLAALLLLLPFFFLLVERIKRIKLISKKRFLPIPSPPKLPFIGNLHQLSLVPHRATWELSKQIGPLMMLNLGTVRAVVVSSSKLAEEFLRNKDICFASRPRLKVQTLLLYGGKEFAFAPYGEYWRQHRKLCITQLLSNKMVQSYAPLRSDEVARMLKTIRCAASQGGAAFSMTRVLNSFANGVVCRTVLGSTMSEERRHLLSELVHINAVQLAEVFVEDFFPWLRWLDVLLGLEGKLRRHQKRWDDLLETMIKEHTNSVKDQAGVVSFIDVLLELHNDSSNTKDLVLEMEEIKATLLVMITAGTDTTFGVLDWCMIELVRHPEVMRKLQNEIRATIINREEIVGEEHVSKMNYLKAVIKEVLRLHPPTPMLLPRESTKDCQIEEYFIPKKTRVHINVFAIGRDPEIWERPEEFLPERFLDCPIDYKGHHFQFLPFGAGRRICPGMQFASKTIEHALANLLYFFDWKFPQGFTREDMDMAEGNGVVLQRKQGLELVAVPLKLNV